MNLEDWIAKSIDLQHGCRAEYGPVELRIETTASLNGFRIYVEDTRLEHPVVHEHLAQSTLESAKQSAVLRADEYLDNRFEAPRAQPSGDVREMRRCMLDDLLRSVGGDQSARN